MEIEAERLGQDLCALSDDDLEQIAGSGDGNFVNITDDQCEKIKVWYASHQQEWEQKQQLTVSAPMKKWPLVVTNYGGRCPRGLFEEAKSKIGSELVF